MNKKTKDKGIRIKRSKVGTLFYRPNWSWDYDIERELKKLCIGRTLNFPCGNSMIGDVRADLDPRTAPDVFADILDPFENFEEGEFDTVICDPPFSMYQKTGWCHEIAKLAKKRIIFCSPNVAIHLKSRVWKKDYLITEKKAVFFFIKIFQIFTRKNQELKE